MPSMYLVSLLLLVPGQVPTIDSADFTAKAQIAAVTATVKIRNVAQNAEGTGALVGKNGPFIYVVTAQHIVQGADRLEISVYSQESYPKAKAVYRSAQVVAESKLLADLALLRVATTDAMPGFVRVCPEREPPANRGFTGLAVGCSGGKPPTCLIERVAEKKTVRRPDSEETATFWEITRKNAEGRSGGPFIDRRGYLVGICSGTNRDKSYFTHISEIHAFLKRHGFRWLMEDPVEP